jgi:DNA-directed RNA polymerase specialized sigma24 family protein
MARIPDIEHRLVKWARWKPGGTTGGLGYSSADMTRERVDSSGAAAIIQDGEQAITDQAVDALEIHLRDTVHVVYLAGGSRARNAQRLGVAESTINTRIDEAHRRLASWFGARAAIARAERDRVEQLQRNAHSLIRR